MFSIPHHVVSRPDMGKSDLVVGLGGEAAMPGPAGGDDRVGRRLR